VKLTYKIYKLQNFEQENSNYFDSLIGFLLDKKITSNTLEEIILSDNIDKEISEYCKDRFRQPTLTRSREYKAIGKTIDFEGKKKIFFDANFVNCYSKFSTQIFLEQILEVFSEDIINLKYPTDAKFYPDTTLTELLKKFIFQWACKVLCNKLKINFEYERDTLHADLNIYVNTFKRNVRKLHYRYQDDTNIETFWIDFITEFDKFIRRCLDVHFDNGSLDSAQEFNEVLRPLIDSIIYQSENIIDDKQVNIDLIKSYVESLLSICYISIPYNDSMYVRITESPKVLFKNTIVDTEPRIVAFLDILGFSSIIEEYDNDYTSNLLNDLHETLEQAVKVSIEAFTDPKIKSDLKDYLEYRMFSDCICISLPYIDFGNDFHIQFHSLAHVVKSYQFAMMQKGFFIRGGISMGSYFADKNMIFSGGLVNAYKIETSVKNPIIAIDDKILNRLSKNYKENTKSLFFDDLFVTHTYDPQILFLNPFDILDNSIKHFGYLQNALTKVSLDNDDDEFSKLTNSLLQLTKSFTDPIFEFAKTQMNESNINQSKNLILDYIVVQIEKHSCSLSQTTDEKEKDINKSIIKKHEFLKSLIEWTKLKNEYFSIYKFANSE
jgi:hypothetical protein